MPPFSQITHDDIRSETGIDPGRTYLKNLFWTPRFYQASSLSNKFEQELLKFRNLQVWKE